MTDLFSILLLLGVGILAGLLNVLAGGGSTLTLPALIFLGLDSALANGTNRVAIIFQNIFAIYVFKRGKYQKFKLSLKLSLITLPGAIAGALIAVTVNDELFQTILGIVMIGVVISMILPKNKNEFLNNENEKITWSVYASMLIIGLYGGFIQVGVGFLIMAALNYLMKLNLVYVNMHKVFIVLIYTIPALLIFILTDNVDWKLGLILSAGHALGGWWAALFSIRKGEKFIKIILAASVLIMSLKLLDVF